MNDDDECPYEEVTGRIDVIDKKMMETIHELHKLASRIQQEPEAHPDERESEKALQDALDNYFIADLLKQKPAGDA